MRANRFDLAVLAVGVGAVSSAAILIREAAAPALVIAAYRLALAAVPLLCVSTALRRPLLTDRRRTMLTVLAGVFLALHFAFWVESVKETSVAASVFLVAASPPFVALASGPLLGEWPTRATWAGIAVATAGAAVMVGADAGGRDALVGDLEALLGALFAAGYLLAGRRLQSAGEGWFAYVTLAYSVAALLLIAMALLAGDSLVGYSGRTYVFLVLLALIPQLLGHTALNRSLGHMSATAVSIAVLGEPVGATLLAAGFLGETPGVLTLLGGALVLLGVYVGLRAPSSENRRSSSRSFA